MSAYRRLTETLIEKATAKAVSAEIMGRTGETDSWLRTLVLLEDELRTMGDDE